jgi:hypothetical protein
VREQWEDVLELLTGGCAMQHVFISYVHEDREQVQQLCDELTAHGVKVWLDRDDIQPGARWKEVIREAIRKGDFFVACFSQAYHGRDKTYMNEELTLAIEELRQLSACRTWFIPVLLSKCDMPAINIGAGTTLHDLQAVPLYEDWENGIQRILDAIQPTPPEEALWQRILEEHYKRPGKPRCIRCGTAYSIDNIYICSSCGADYCIECVWELEQIGEGPPHKWKCPCGGELR